jgi:hypothetical protein
MRIVATYAVPGVQWHQCPGCIKGTIWHQPSCSWTHDACGESGIFGAHDCPKDHNHPMCAAGFEGIRIFRDDDSVSSEEFELPADVTL